MIRKTYFPSWESLSKATILVYFLVVGLTTLHLFPLLHVNLPGFLEPVPVLYYSISPCRISLVSVVLVSLHHYKTIWLIQTINEAKRGLSWFILSGIQVQDQTSLWFRHIPKVDKTEERDPFSMAIRTVWAGVPRCPFRRLPWQDWQWAKP